MFGRLNISDIAAGVIIAILFVTTAVSTAALIFAGLPALYYLTGVTILLVATAICALVGAFFSGFWGAVIGPRSGIAPAYAGMVAAIAATMQTSGADPAATFATVIASMMTATAATGVILYLLGQFQLGGLVRYIPYPVMGGFFAGIGLIFLQGGTEVSVGLPLTAETLDRYLSQDGIRLLGPAFAFGLVTYLLQRRTGHWAVMPGTIVVAIGAFYAMLGSQSLALGDAIAAGWLPDVREASSHWPPLSFADIARIEWPLILSESGSIATIAMLSAIILLLEVSGVEIVGDCEIDPNRELKAAGAANVGNGFLGGFAGVHSASETALAVKMGAGSRVMGLAFAAGILATIALGTGFIGLIPNFVLGGLLVFLGLNFLVDWLWRNRRDIPKVDYLLILAILLVIATAGLLEGIAFGIAVATVLFVISYSRLGIIKAELNGRDHSSHVVRGIESRDLLAEEARRIHIVKLQGFIFFGTADSLLETLRRRLNEGNEPTDYLILDFKHVSRIDTSAVQAFAKLKRLAERNNLAVVLTDLAEREYARLDHIGFFTDYMSTTPLRATGGTPDSRPRFALPFLDDGVAWCEEDILYRKSARRAGEAIPLEDQLTEVMGSRNAAARIAPYFEVLDMEAGAFLFYQGDPGDGLYMLSEGVASVVLGGDGGAERAIRIFQRGTLLGEMAIYTQAPRTAAVRVDEDSRLFRLSLDGFEAMQREAPRAAGLFHSYVVRLLAERLDRANREIQQLS
ncbi:MAG: SulP family inorganic anion transporter [Rhodospirillales bacterium]